MDTKQKCCCLCRNENECVWWRDGITDGGLWAGEIAGHGCPSKGAAGQSQVVPTQGSHAVLRVAVPIRSKGGGQQGHQLLGGNGDAPRCPRTATASCSSTGTQHFPSKLGQFLPPAVEQASPLPPAQTCTHSQCHSIPFPSPPYSPTAAPLATGAALGRTKARDVSTSQPQRDHCT